MFKSWTWKEWVVLVLALLVIIGEVVLVFVQPWSALYVAVASIFMFAAGWTAGKHITIKESK